MKKLRRILIFAAMVAVLTCLLCVALNAETYSGTCGENLTWTLDSDGLLKISGTGDMSGYYFSDDIPWVKYCQSIKTVEISAGVTSIGSGAFSGCTGLTSIEISDSVTSIGSSAFKDCTSLTSIEIPEGVTSIGYLAFSGCKSLTSIIFGENSRLTSIENSAFYACTNLTSIKLPDSVTVVGYEAFFLCDNLTSIEIPASVTGIGKGAIPSSATIYGEKGSAAEKYAADSGLNFASAQNEFGGSTAIVVAAAAVAVVLIVLLTIVFIKKKKSA